MLIGLYILQTLAVKLYFSMINIVEISIVII